MKEREDERVSEALAITVAIDAVELVAPGERGALALARTSRSARLDPAAAFIDRQHPSTQPAYRRALDVCAEVLSSGSCDRSTMPWHLVDYANAQRMRAELARRFRASTTNKILAAFRGLLQEVWELASRGALPPVDFFALEQARKIKNVHDGALPGGVPFNAAELSVLFSLCDGDTSPKGRRDAALLALLRQTGGRRFEVAALDVADYDSETGEMRFRVMKRGKQKRSCLASDARLLVNDWLTVRGCAAGPLLCPVARWGIVRIARLSGKAVWRVVTERCAEAGLRHHKPHDWRHTMATDLQDLGVPLREIQERMGHAQITTTQRYTHVSADALRRGAELLTVPRRRN